ncbi:MAG: oligosaccharide flippase family protein [bacterium]
MQQSQASKITIGYIAISAAKFVFMLSGFAIYFALPRLLSPADFGNYGVTIGFLSIFNMMLVIGAIQTVSKFVSEQPEQKRPIMATAFRSQALLGGGISLLLLLSAPYLAKIFKDPSLTSPFRIGAGIPFFYAFYATVIGLLNGQKRYQAQAMMDMATAVIKTVCIISLAYVTRRVEGAVAAFFLTSILIASMALVLYRNRHPNHPSEAPKFPLKTLLNFQFSIMLLTLMGHVLLTQDLFLIKYYSGRFCTPDSAGFYTSAQTLSRIPQVLVIALNLVMFPVISSSTYRNDGNTSRRAVEAAFRFPLIAIAPLAVFLSAFSTECLALVFPAPYSAAAPALQILAPAVFILALLQLGTTVITGGGRPWLSIRISLVGILFQASACLLLTPAFGLRGAAWGSGIGWAVGLLFCGNIIFHHFKTRGPLLTLLRAVPAGALTWFSTHYLPFSGIPRLISGLIFTTLVYWGLLLVMGERGFRIRSQPDQL